MSTVDRIEDKLHQIGVKYAYVSMLSASQFTICDVDDISFDLLRAISRVFGTTDINIKCEHESSSALSHEREIHVRLPGE